MVKLLWRTFLFIQLPIYLQTVIILSRRKHLEELLYFLQTSFRWIEVSNPDDIEFCFRNLRRMCRVLIHGNHCFYVSMTLFWLAPSGLRLCVSTLNDKLESHVWVEINGKVYSTTRDHSESIFEVVRMRPTSSKLESI